MKNATQESLCGLVYGLAIVAITLALVYSASVAILPVKSDIHAEHELTGYRILWDQWLGE
jgi:hypothetical protein